MLTAGSVGVVVPPPVFLIPVFVKPIGHAVVAQVVERVGQDRATHPAGVGLPQERDRRQLHAFTVQLPKLQFAQAARDKGLSSPVRGHLFGLVTRHRHIVDVIQGAVGVQADTG